MYQMQQAPIRADRDRQDTRRAEVLRPQVCADVIPGSASQPGQAVAGHDDRPTPDGIAAVTDMHTSRARIWPFGEGYVSQLAPHYGKQDGRGQHMVGKPDTSKYAPKHPKAGKPLAGNRAPKGAK